MDENHNQNVNNWKNSWKDNWKGNYQSSEDGYLFEGYKDDTTPQSFKEVQNGLKSDDPDMQKKALTVFAVSLITAIIAIGCLVASMDVDFSELLTRISLWIGNK